MTQFLRALKSLTHFAAYKANRHRKSILVEISNVCNAQCYYCQTGWENRNHITHPGTSFMEVERFKQILAYARKTSFVKGQSLVTLHNWHEPLLHPDFSSIIKAAQQASYCVELSTNANVLPKISPDFDASPIAMTIFSMPGFSQASYDKIHRFDFEHIKHNIAQIVKTFRQHGCFGRFIIAFHVYQFNTHELQAAKAFARSLAIDLWPYFAFICDGPRHLQYLKGTLPNDYLLNVSKDLFMGFYMKNLKPSTFCPVAKNLTVDVDGNCRMCCNDDTLLGNVFEMTPDRWDRIHQEHPVCKECMALGKANWELADDLNFPLQGFAQFKRINFTYLKAFALTCLQSPKAENAKP